MAHKDVLSIFKRNFEELYSRITVWFPCGKDCVRIRFANGDEIMFTYHGEKDWCLESVNSYVSKMKGRI